MKHYQEKLSAYLHYELPSDERREIGEHLLLCDGCRREHDAIKLGTTFASELRSSDAPEAVWANITDALDGRSAPQIGLIPQESFFSVRRGFAFAVALIAVSALSALVYIGLFSGDSPYRAQEDRTRPPGVNDSQVISQEPELPVNTSSPEPGTNVNAGNANSQPQPGSNDGWQVETIAGSPKIGAGTANGNLAVGEYLETDSRSRARIDVADIGSVEIGPNSRVKLVGTGSDEHRLSLDRGGLHAKIFAPPRLFVVDTPSGKAVDLGCEYTLEVDKNGDSKLHVTGGYVALEREGRESIVPAGAMCLMRKGVGLGTPFSAEASPEFQAALTRFDFARGGSSAVKQLVERSEFYDMITLWHLLSRVGKSDRGPIFDTLAKHVPPPAGVTKEGIVQLDKKMLGMWKDEVDNAWFN